MTDHGSRPRAGLNLLSPVEYCTGDPQARLEERREKLERARKRRERIKRQRFKKPLDPALQYISGPSFKARSP